MRHPPLRLATERPASCPTGQHAERVGMQDKYNIGPVTIVQLVGLSAKPKIASVSIDAAARAADTIPTSAAAGLGDDLTRPPAELDTSFQAATAAPQLGVSADPTRSHMSLEGGVDRPVVDEKAPASTIDPSEFDNNLPDKSLPDPSIGPRGEATSPDSVPKTSPDATGDKPANADAAALKPDVPFDGTQIVVDDHIVDFSVQADSTATSLDASESTAVVNDNASASDLSGFEGWGDFAIPDSAGGVSPEPQLMHDDFVASVQQLSVTDAIPVL